MRECGGCENCTGHEETSLHTAAGAQDLTIEDLTCFAPCGILRPVCTLWDFKTRGILRPLHFALLRRSSAARFEEFDLVQ